MEDLLSAEEVRLRALASYTVLDTLPEEEYDAITRIAAQVCQTPVSLITLLDDHRQWFKSAHGLAIRETLRQYAFCDHAIRTPNQLMEVTDARTDERFANNPLTIGEPHIIFYAGVPLVDTDGQALGTLCVIDHKPNKLSAEQAVALKALAGQVVTQLQLRRSQALLKKANQKLQDNNQVLQAVVDNCPAGLVLWEAIRENDTIIDFQYILTNPINARMTNRPIEQLVGQSLKQQFPGVVANGLFDRLTTVVETGQRQEYQQFDEFDTIRTWGDFTIVPVGPNRVLFTIQDITKLKHIEEQLRTYTGHLTELITERTAEIRHLSALQNAILENAGLAIIASDKKGTIQTANPAAQRLLQYWADELIGQTNPSFLFDSGELMKQAELMTNQLGRPVKPDFDLFKAMVSRQRYECTVVRKDGRRVPILMITTALYNETGAVTGYVAMGTDITDLKAARAELKRKNQELNTFFEVALDLHCIADAGGNILKANQAWQTMLGYTTAELETVNHYDLVHPEDRDATIKVITEIIGQRHNRKNVNRFRRKDGEYRLIEWNIVSVDGLLYASARDITEQKRAEQELKNLNQRLQLATQAGGQGIWEWDFEHDSLIWDEQIYKLHNIERRTEPLFYQDFLAHLHPDDANDARTIRNQLVSGQLTRFTHEARIIQPNQTIRHTESHGIAIHDMDGRPTRVIGVVWDITERKQALNDLRDSEQRFREITENVNELFWTRSATSPRFIYMSPAYERLTGLTVESLYENSASFLATVLDEDRERVTRAFLQNPIENYVITFRIHNKDGVIRWLSARGFVVRDEAGLPLRRISTAIDITSQKEKESVLQQSLERERELNRLKSQFVATASHEFRTPLATIQSSVDLIKLHLSRSLATSLEAVDRHLIVIEKEVAGFSELLNDMLTVGRIEAGKVSFDPQPVNLSEMVNEVLKTHFSNRRDGSEVQISITGEPRPIRVDSRLIDHALVNLISNSFKFSAHPPELHLTYGSHQVVLTLIDRGIGIPADDLPHLFEMFFRAKNAVAIQGSGLGLAITRQFIELHGGTITVCSEENIGTTFTVSLPG